MANWCSYEMKIKGPKESINEFLILDDYDVDNHFYRMFEYDNTGIDQIDENTYETTIYGDCAWSIYSCCIAGYTEVNLFEYHTRRLGLKLEVFSEEPGMCFSEHYIYENGNEVVSECVEYNELCWDAVSDRYEDFISDHPSVNLTREQFDNERYITIGGFEKDEFGNWIYEI